MWVTCLGAAAEDEIDVSLVTSRSYSGQVVSVLTDDLVSKQAAMEKLQRAVQKAEGSSQLGQWRVHEVEKRNGVLAADVAQLRKLLHEEKSSSKVTHHLLMCCSSLSAHNFLLSYLFGRCYCNEWNKKRRSVLMTAAAQLRQLLQRDNRLHCVSSLTKSSTLKRFVL